MNLVLLRKQKFSRNRLTICKCKESLQSVSQLAAVDCCSIDSIGKSKFIRVSLSAKGFHLPSSDSSIMNLIHSKYNDIQHEIKAKIEIKVGANTHFSVNMDEYTLVCCRRYLNIDVHCQHNVVKLGIMRILESCNTEKILQLLEK